MKIDDTVLPGIAENLPEMLVLRHRIHAHPELAYEEFATADITRISELRLSAVEERLDLELQLGRHRVVIGELESFVATYPLRERLRGLLMIALYRAGRQVNGAIEPGDLVFFSTVAPGASHVGIAIGGDEFVHAPSSTGEVRVERLGAAYWSTRFVGARRVL